MSLLLAYVPVPGTGIRRVSKVHNELKDHPWITALRIVLGAYKKKMQTPDFYTEPLDQIHRDRFPDPILQQCD